MSRSVTIARSAPEPEERTALLRSLELLGALDDQTLEELSKQVRWVEVQAGTLVLEEGDPSDSMYFVVHGRLGILQHADGIDRLVREVGAGQPIGELGLLLDQLRSASATALRDSLLVELDRSTFDRLIEREPSLLLPLTKRLAQRLATIRPGSPLDVPAETLIVAASPSVDLSGLWGDLAPLLTDLGARCLSIGELTKACGSTGELEPWRATRWVETQARANGHPIFILGDDQNAAEALAPGIDRTLVFADATAPVGIGPLESQLAELRKRGVPDTFDLALLHPGDSELPRDTSAWLDRLRPARHHHIRVGNRRDLERLSRLVTGNAIALALGGGGARGFAHIGAIRALREAEQPIDMVAGTNMGALVGAQLALGWDTERMADENENAFRRMGRDLSLPFVSLLSDRRLRSGLKRMLGDVLIEDLWLGFHCVTVDLSWCGLVSKRRGSLCRWVRASLSTPGIHPPVVDEGRLYVDGGLLESVPIRPLREAGAGTILAIDSSPFRRHTVDERIQEAPTGVDYLFHSVPVVGGGFPGILTLIYRALSVAQQSRRQEYRAISDLYVEPPVDRFGVTDYDKLHRIIEYGYEETKRRLDEEGLPAFG